MKKGTFLLGAVLAAAGLSGCATTRTEESGNLHQELDPHDVLYVAEPEPGMR